MKLFTAWILICGAATAQSVQPESGNWQLVRTQFLSQPLVVRVMNGAAPVMGARIHWTANGGSMRETDTTTGSDGRSIARWIAPNWVLGTKTIEYHEVTATAQPGGIAKFGVTAYEVNTQSGVPSVGVVRESPMSGQRVTGAIGTPAALPVTLRFKAQSGPMQGRPIPHIAIHAVPGNPAGPASVSCEAISGEDGVATCHPSFTGQAGSGAFGIAVAGVPPTGLGDWFTRFDDIVYQVTGGTVPSPVPTPTPVPVPMPIPPDLNPTLACEGPVPTYKAGSSFPLNCRWK